MPRKPATRRLDALPLRRKQARTIRKRHYQFTRGKALRARQQGTNLRCLPAQWSIHRRESGRPRGEGRRRPRRRRLSRKPARGRKSGSARAGRQFDTTVGLSTIESNAPKVRTYAVPRIESMAAPVPRIKISGPAAQRPAEPEWALPPRTPTEQAPPRRRVHIENLHVTVQRPQMANNAAVRPHKISNCPKRRRVYRSRTQNEHSTPGSPGSGLRVRPCWASALNRSSTGGISPMRRPMPTASRPTRCIHPSPISGSGCRIRMLWWIPRPERACS